MYKLFHNFLFWTNDLIKGTGIYKIASEIKKEQYLPTDKLEKLQLNKLKLILNQANNHSLYYQALFKNIGFSPDDLKTLEDLQKIPLLRRINLQENSLEILTTDSKSATSNSSGGSTGNPVNFYQDDYYWNYAKAAEKVFYSWMNIKSGDKTVVFWGSDREFKDWSTYDKVMQKLNRIKMLNSFTMTEQTIISFIKEINDFKPKYIYGYAASLYLVAKYINNSNCLNTFPIAIRSSAETLFEYQRDEIEKAFNCDVFNTYGSREVNNLAVECSAHEGLHCFSSGRIIEVVDPNGHPVPYGETGQIAITDLTNFSFPFIRYLNGDLAIKKKNLCSCGRGYPLIDKLCGRVSEILDINGKLIHSEFFTHLFYGKPEIKKFQIIYENESLMNIFVECDNKDYDFQSIINNIQEKIGQKIEIKVEFKNSIEPSPSGKHSFIISKVKNRFL